MTQTQDRTATLTGFPGYYQVQLQGDAYRKANGQPRQFVTAEAAIRAMQRIGVRSLTIDIPPAAPRQA
ncbi:hypothetical protein [Chromobacterium sp. IIBBL 290-4]|uniref:hypothetical protein n=1 Tax=Chromobacterium sp. IIBBL 290-4 TaxID=2953890 RepID=UPI0020B889D5|nr:hypothetical protein [Chromobacterium sp. IIBBL 290-4]UTH72503.1 hypothetical protein NKT35_13180 [Chromobacterium sp. IIBBL 290-4]